MHDVEIGRRGALQLSWDRTGVSLTVGQGFYSSYGGTFTTLEEDYYVTKKTLSGTGAKCLRVMVTIIIIKTHTYIATVHAQACLGHLAVK